MSGRDRIDVHQHFLPPFYAARLHEVGLHEAGGRELPAWSADEALALMDRHEIATGIVSISTPGVRLDASERGAAARRSIDRDGASALLAKTPEIRAGAASPAGPS
jgi:peptidoglycan/xylan/chitin deacetylase (PgdA/CDA1 family)